MKNMIPATNGKSIYIPAQGDWRSRRYDEASTLDEIVLSLSGPCTSIHPPPRDYWPRIWKPPSGFRLISKHPPYDLKDALVFRHAFCTNTHTGFLHSPSAPAKLRPFWKRKDTINKPRLLRFLPSGGFVFVYITPPAGTDEVHRVEGRPTVAPIILHH